jgi:hypothetical protein
VHSALDVKSTCGSSATLGLIGATIVAPTMKLVRREQRTTRGESAWLSQLSWSFGGGNRVPAAAAARQQLPREPWWVILSERSE